MKTVEIIESFEGYPNGDGQKVVFVVEQTPTLPDEFAELIVAKGHAREPVRLVRGKKVEADK